MWDSISPYLAAIVPTIGLIVIAYVVFKTIFEADRRERKAVAEWEAGRPARSDDGAANESTGDAARP